MSVYVDPIIEYGGSESFRWRKSCHMYADTLFELHTMAKTIGLQFRWFQNDSRLPHYDLVFNKRKLAIENGAIETSLKHMVEHMWKEKK